MPRATNITLAEIAALDNLAYAAWRAAGGKRDRREVQMFFGNLDASLAQLGQRLRLGLAPRNHYRRFTVFDPKRRTIHAPIFEDRVVHHALIAQVGPLLERSLVFDSYACRQGKGTLAAVRRAQRFCRRYPWYGKLDVRRYFHSIHHITLQQLLRRHLKGEALELSSRIIGGFEVAPGRGLPIGALTSQYFANLYLGVVDRWLAAVPGVCAMVRYLDDIIFWCNNKAMALQVGQQAAALARSRLLLELHPPWIQRTSQGLSFLGFRVFPRRLLLSRRRMKRYRQALQRAEARYLRGCSNALQLQADAMAAIAITAHADSRAWRAAQLRRRPSLDV